MRWVYPPFQPEWPVLRTKAERAAWNKEANAEMALKCEELGRLSAKSHAAIMEYMDLLWPEAQR